MYVCETCVRCVMMSLRKREEEQRRREAEQQISLARTEKQRMLLARAEQEQLSLAETMKELSVYEREAGGGANTASKAEQINSKEETRKHRGTDIHTHTGGC